MKDAFKKSLQNDNKEITKLIQDSIERDDKRVEAIKIKRKAEKVKKDNRNKK